jgi:predicted membrane channel-forming protein YqfA (hemolysin III family)
MNAIDESLPLQIWTQSAGEEVANGISHGIGLVGAMIGTPILLLAALHHSNIPFLIGTSLTMLGIVWALALFGVVMKATRGALRHRKLAMTLYLGTGWLAVLFVRPLALAIPLSALLCLIAGGIAYTAGTSFFANERLRYGHFVWHLFVLAGTSCHFAAVFICTI